MRDWCTKRGKPRTALRESRLSDLVNGLPPNQKSQDYYSLCLLQRQTATSGANSTLDRNPSRHKSRVGPTGCPMILVPVRDSDRGKGNEYPEAAGFRRGERPAV